MFNFFKKNKTNAKTELLKLEYDFNFKVLVIVNAFFLVMFTQYTKLFWVSALDWSQDMWIIWILTVIVLIVDGYFFIELYFIYTELKKHYL